MLNDNDVEDYKNDEGKEVDKEEEGEVIEKINYFWIDTVKHEFFFSFQQNIFWVLLHHHALGTLVELYVRMLLLAEHDRLRGGQDDGDEPGAGHHQSEEDVRAWKWKHFFFHFTTGIYNVNQIGSR